MRVLPYLFAGFLASVMVGLKTYEDLSKGRGIYLELRDLKGTIKYLEKKGVVGMANDTYSYLIPAYGYYKNLLPVVEVDGERYFASYRFLSSWVFVPFMWLFKGYFPHSLYNLLRIRGYAWTCLSDGRITCKTPNFNPFLAYNLPVPLLPYTPPAP